MRLRRLVGVAILIVAAVGVAAYGFAQELWGELPVRYDPIKLRGYVSDEKLRFVDDPAVQKILRTRYKIDLDVTGAESIEMVRGNTAEADFLWPSSQVALEMYRAQNKPLVKDEIIFGSPLVILSWDNVVGGLEREGLAKRVNDSYYALDLAPLLNLALSGKSWRDAGVPELYGAVKLSASDPNRSGSGNLFAGLVANTLNGGEVVDEAGITLLLPKVKRLFSSMGYLPASSTDLFAQYLKQGAGGSPLAVAFESQVIEMSLDSRRFTPALRDKIRVLYPEPTVWAGHPLIVTSDKGKRLVEALTDPDVQKIAWSKHGFRTGTGLTKEDVSSLPLSGVPVNIDKVTPMPSVGTMQQITTALK